MSEYFEFLDDLRESGEVNMFGAPRVLQDMFGVGRYEARDIVAEWMKQFGKKEVDNWLLRCYNIYILNNKEGQKI